MILKDFFNRLTAYAGNEELPKWEAEIQSVELVGQETMPLQETVSPKVEKISLASIIDIKDLRINALEAQIKFLNERLLQDNKKIPTTNRKNRKIVDVVCDLFCLSGEELNAYQVLERMDKKKLKNKKPDIRSVRATLYYLKGMEVLEFGKKKGTFKYNVVKSLII